jgi:hypothetical protein
MSDAVLRAVVKVCVVLAFVVLASLFFFIRSRSRKAKLWLLAAVVGLVLAFVALWTIDRIRSWGPSPEHARKIEALEDLVRDRPDQIEKVRGKIATLTGLVAGGNWLPAGDLACPREESEATLYWAFQLRGAEHAEFGDPGGGHDELEALFQCAGHPERAQDDLIWWSPERLTAVLDRSDVPLAFVVEIVSVVKPEVKNVRFNEDRSITGDFEPGRVEFRLAVVDTSDGKIVAHGGGAAMSGDKVSITGAPDVLASDLRSQTRKAALELGWSLIQPE